MWVRTSASSPEGLRRIHEFLRYLTDTGVFLRGQSPVEVRADKGDIQALRQAQRFLRCLLARLDITVEANPSSNLLIGDLEMQQHPIFRLQPLPGQEGEEPPVLVALGDDDPVTFASCLPDEYSHLFYALLRQGLSAQRAQEWLERVRRNGLRARFSLPESVAAVKPQQLRAPDLSVA